jgi:hypothetical protein
MGRTLQAAPRYSANALSRRPSQLSLPWRPAVEVGDVQKLFPDGQEHVDLGGQGLGLPAAEAVVYARETLY